MRSKSLNPFRIAIALVLVQLITLVAEAQVQAGFTISSGQGCAPFSVNFSNTSSGAVSYHWDFGNGNYSNVPNPQNVYVNPGNYTVSLIVTGQGGIKDTMIRQNLITAMPGPSAGFTVNRMQGCMGSTSFQFSNTSTGAVSYFWDFGDGTSSLQPNPVKIYETPGLKTVKLKATNAAGCQTVYTLPQQIQILGYPNPGFSSNITSSCEQNQSFQFTAGTQGAFSYLWQFGDGTVSTQANPNKIYNTPGSFTVQLKVSNQGGCSDSLTKQDYIHVYSFGSLQIAANDSAGCAPFKPRISSNISDAVSYQWDFGNGQTSTAASFSPTYNSSGVFTISLQVRLASGCSFSKTEQAFIRVSQKPRASFTLSNTVGCAPLSPRITNQSSGAMSYYWTFGDNTTSTEQNPQKTYTQSGQYTIRLQVTSAEGCSETFQLTNSITVNAPKALFVASDTMGCPPLVVRFTNLSQGSSSCLWIFGDGTTSTENNPVKTYQALGEYDVTLIATSSNGCKDTLRKVRHIQVNFDQANYTPPAPVRGCAPFTASFQNNDPNAIGYIWDFGDGNTSTQANPTHVYENPGTYTVSLIVDHGTNCKQYYEVYQQIIVEGGAPVFTVDISPCPPHIVSFKDTTHGAVSWFWEFGDGTTSTDQYPTHVYDENKIHHVTLTTTTSSGCTNTYIGFNAVNFASLAASFVSYYEPGPFPRTVYFHNTTPGATTWNWDFGDGNTSTEQNPVHTYQTEDDYIVSLTVNSDSCERTGLGSAFASVMPAEETGQDTASGGNFPPENAIPEEPLTGCAPINITFFKQDTSHHVLLWSFGDGATSTLQRPQHLYTESGYYSVFYIAETPSGLDTIQYPQAIRIGGDLPEFTLVKEDFCTHSHVEVKIMNEDYRKVTWTFGGSRIVQGPEVSHDFPVSNSASNILVMVEDTLGCKTSLLRSIFTNPPIPEITYPAYVCKDKVQFKQAITNPDGYTFFWEFGDGNTSTAFEPEHQYAATGSYQVKLTVKDPSGCLNSFVLPNQVNYADPKPNFEFLSPTSGCAPLRVEVNYAGEGQAMWQWTNLRISFTNRANYTYTSPGVYGFKLTVTSYLVPGCKTTQDFNNQITVHGAATDFSFSQDRNCFPVTARFNDLSQNASSWFWDFGNGITSTEKNPVITFNEMPADSFLLHITTADGCTGTIKKAGLNILDGKLSMNFSGQCKPLPVSFKAEPADGVNWEWHFGNGQTASGSEVAHIFPENGNFRVYAIGSSAGNCRDTVWADSSIVVTGPRASFSSPTPASCAPSVVEFIDQSEHAVDWKWDFGDGSTSSIQHPVKLYERPGKYDIQLIVFASNGCSDTLKFIKYVTVLGPATSFNAEVREECEKTIVNFKDLSNGAVEWEWNFGEGRTSSERNPEFIYNQEGDYTVTLFSKDTLGCSAFYTLQLPVIVHNMPSASFSVSSMEGCTPLQISTTNQSNRAIKYHWNFNDLVQSNANNPGFTFMNPGYYFAELVAESDFGCKDTMRIDSIHALMVPVAGFTLDHTEGCTPLHVSFSNTSYHTELPRYSWNFGNGGRSNEVNPTQVYYETGFYEVSLHVQNANGCSDTISLPSIVQVFDTLAAPVSPIIRVSVVNETSVFIEWEQSMAPDFGKYTLYRKNNLSGQFEPVGIISEAHTVSFVDQGLNTLSNVYCYKLETADRCGYYVETDSLIAHCTIDVETETQTNNTVDVKWTPYIGKKASQYRIYRQEENNGTLDDLGTVEGDVLFFKDTTLYCPVKYKYSVKAEGLNGIWHVESNSDYDISQPIQNLFKDQRVDASRSTVIENKSVLTEWKTPEIMGHKVSTYKIFRSIDNINFDEIAEVPAYQLSYLDESVNVQKVKYYYRIMAGNDCGLQGVNGGFSDNIVLKVSPTEDYRIGLNWTPYTGWGDHGVGFYVIERQKEDGNWEIIMQVPGQVNSAVDEN
jgi:PKD repeat protein